MITLDSFEGKIKFTNKDFSELYSIVNWYQRSPRKASDAIADYCYEHDLYEYNVSAVYDAISKYIKQGGGLPQARTVNKRKR